MITKRAERFDRAHSENADPWDFATSPYEWAKYDASVAALPRARYRVAIEAGCSIGELTRRLSARCGEVVGIDVSAVAIEEAARRNAGYDNVSFLQCEIPAEWPDIEADLVVLSEVLYYLSVEEIEALAARIAGALPGDGDCVLVNYMGNTEEPLQGLEAAKLFMRAMRRHVPSLRHRSAKGSRLKWLLARNIPWLRHSGFDGAGYRIDILSNAPDRHR